MSRRRLLTIRSAIYLLSGTVFVTALNANAERDCRPAAEAPAPVIDRRYFFPGELTPPQMKHLFEDFQLSRKRYEYRGHVSAGRFVVPYAERNDTGMKLREFVEFPPQVIRAIAKHMSVAFRKNFARYPFFPDMGHGHFLVPKTFLEKVAQEKLSGREVYQQVLSLPDLKIIYHASELLKYDGPDVGADVAFLRDHRNIIATIARPEDLNAYPPPGPPPDAIEGLSQYGHFYMTISPSGCLTASFGERESLGMDISVIGPSYVPQPRGEDED